MSSYSTTTWRRIAGATSFAAIVSSAALAYSLFTMRMMRRRLAGHASSAQVAPIQDNDAESVKGASASASSSPSSSNSIADFPDIHTFRTPTPESGSKTLFTCPYPLPVGATIRFAVPSDAHQVYLLLRSASTVRDGLAREVDEIDEEYAEEMIQPVNEGGVVLVVEYDPTVAAAAANTEKAAASSPSSSSTSTTPPSSSPILIGILKACRYGPTRCLRGSLNDITIAIHRDYHNRKLAQHLFSSFFHTLSTPEFQHILRVEMGCRKINVNAWKMYLKCGFQVSQILHSRLTSGAPLNMVNDEEDELQFRTDHDLDLVWFNPNFSQEALRKQLRMISKERRSNRPVQPL